MNDAEAAYEICCPNDFGILLLVGTGVVCIGRKDGKRHSLLEYWMKYLNENR